MQEKEKDLQEQKQAFISIRHIRKVYRMGDEKVVALDDVSLDID